MMAPLDMLMMESAAVLFGVGWGVLLAWLDAHTRDWVPYVCSGALLVAAIIAVIALGGSGGSSGLLIATAVPVSCLAASGVFWRTHPALAGRGYLTRVWTMATAGREIRRRRDDSEPQA